MRVNQGIPYLLGAARYSRLVGDLDAANAGKEFGDFWEEIRDHAVSCVFFADAAIESYANELFKDAPDIFSPELDLKPIWSEAKRKSPLHKLDLALSLRGKPKLDQDSSIFKSINALWTLRDKLTDFKPEWSNEFGIQLDISEKLKGYIYVSS